MTSTHTGVTSSIELVPTGTTPERNAVDPDLNLDWQSPTTPANPDNIIEASRIYDSTAPDGGYG